MSVRFEVLLARLLLLLLLHLVRDKHGVEILGTLLCSRDWIRAFQAEGLAAAAWQAVEWKRPGNAPD